MELLLKGLLYLDGPLFKLSFVYLLENTLMLIDIMGKLSILLLSQDFKELGFGPLYLSLLLLKTIVDLLVQFRMLLVGYLK